jgi:hypothetical protein
MKRWGNGEKDDSLKEVPLGFTRCFQARNCVVNFESSDPKKIKRYRAFRSSFPRCNPHHNEFRSSDPLISKSMDWHYEYSRVKHKIHSTHDYSKKRPINPASSLCKMFKEKKPGATLTYSGLDLSIYVIKGPIQLVRESL